MIYYVRVQVYAVPINCDPFAKGAKASTWTRTRTPTPSTNLTAALLPLLPLLLWWHATAGSS